MQKAVNLFKTGIKKGLIWLIAGIIIELGLLGKDYLVEVMIRKKRGKLDDSRYTRKFYKGDKLYGPRED